MPFPPAETKLYSRLLYNHACIDSVSSAWGAIRRTYLAPIQVPFRLTVDRIWAMFGTTVISNIAGAIYKDNGDTPVGGARVVQFGSTGMVVADSNRIKGFVIADTALDAKLHWLAIQASASGNWLYLPSARWTAGNTGTLQGYRFTVDVGVFPTLTDPCPACTLDATGLWVGGLRVKSVP